MFEPTQRLSRFFVALSIFSICWICPTSFAEETQHGVRMERPLFFGLGIGNPAPAWVGGSLGFQIHNDSQLLISYGHFWSGDLTIKSIEAALRFQLLPTAFSPAIGAGINSLHLNGEGTIQTLRESSLLASLFIGFDWSFPSSLRVLGGMNFHVPLRLNFPIICVGWNF